MNMWNQNISYFGCHSTLGAIQIIYDTQRGEGSTKCHTDFFAFLNTISNAFLK